MTPEESSKLSLFQIFQLYVDPIVDNIHPKIKQVLGFDPIDEPLLSLVFTKKICSARKRFGRNILLPKPEALLAMKLNSVIHRDKEHKRIKDITDIYALLWFSDVNLSQLKASLLSIYPEGKAKKTVHSFTGEEISRVSETIDVQEGEVKRVLSKLR